jgi:hypothetical protein
MSRHTLDIMVAAALVAAALTAGCSAKQRASGPPSPKQLVEQAKFGYDIRGKYTGTAKVGYMTSTGSDTAEYKVSLEIDSTCRLVSASWHDVHYQWTDRIITWTYPAEVEMYHKERVVGKEPAVDQAEVDLHRVGTRLACDVTSPRFEVERFTLDCQYPETGHPYFKPQTGELRYDSSAGILVDTVWAAFPPLPPVAVPREKVAITVNGWAIDTYIKKEYLLNSRKYAGQTVDLRRLPDHDYTVRVPNTPLSVTMTGVTLQVTNPGTGMTLPEGRIDCSPKTEFLVSMDKGLWVGVVVFPRDGKPYFLAKDRGYVFPLERVP